MRVMPLQFRAAGLEDIDALERLVHAAYRGEESLRGWTSEATMLDGQRTDGDALAGMISRPGSRIVIAEDSGLAGCCHLAIDDGSAYLGLLSVWPDGQARGVGRALVEHAEHLARGAHARRLWMTVIRQRTELIAWYARRGFHPTGETQPFPYGDQRFGVPKRPDLEFVVLEKRLEETT